MTISIQRDLGAASASSHDLIVVGGGIQGACMALEAAQCGLQVVLVERSDFGGATSANSLRIIHGGLRYLQSFQRSRYCQAVHEQAWWLQQFPDLVRPLPCLLPLDGRGLHRRWLMELAAYAHRSWSQAIRENVSHAIRRPNLSKLECRVAGRDETRALTASLMPQDFGAGLLWHDAVMESPARLLMEVLRWAVACGATALNYLQVDDLHIDQGKVCGVMATCALTSARVELTAPRVVYCVGPWTNELSTSSDPHFQARRQLVLAYNLVIDRPLPLPSLALAIRAPERMTQSPTYFLVPRGRRTMVGTIYEPWSGPVTDRPVRPTNDSIVQLIRSLRNALPGWGVTERQIAQVQAGLLPAEKSTARLSYHPEIRGHGHEGGPRGLWTVHGVKYTTARAVAERVIQRICDGKAAKFPRTARPRVRSGLSLISDQSAGGVADNNSFTTALLDVIKNESVQHLDDLLLRRIDLLRWSAHDIISLAENIVRVLDWDSERCRGEIERLTKRLAALEWHTAISTP